MKQPKKTWRETIGEIWDDMLERMCTHFLIEAEHADQVLRLILACAVAVVLSAAAFGATWALIGKPAFLLLMPLLLAALTVLAGRGGGNS